MGSLFLAFNVLTIADFSSFKNTVEFVAQNSLFLGSMIHSNRMINVVREKWNIIDETPKQEKREVRGVVPQML